MKEIETYESLNLDSKQVELIDVKSKKDEITPIKSDSSTDQSSLNDSMEHMNSLIVKEKPISNKYPNIKPKSREGNTIMYFFDKNGSPKIVIGPHCKKNNNIKPLYYRDLHNLFTIVCCIFIFTLLYRIMGIFKLFY